LLTDGYGVIDKLIDANCTTDKVIVAFTAYTPGNDTSTFTTPADFDDTLLFAYTTFDTTYARS